MDTINGIWRGETLYSDDLPQTQIPRYREEMTFRLGNRESLSAQDRRIIGQLGLKFRGRSAWPYFRRTKAFCFPVALQEKEAACMVSVLQNLFMVVRAVRENRVPRPGDGEMFVRQFDEQDRMWKTGLAQLSFPAPEFVQAVVTDELGMERLKRLELLDVTLELDAACMPFPCKDKRISGAFYPQCCLIAEHDSGHVCTAETLLPTEQPWDSLLRQLFGWMEEQAGLPAEILVRDQEVYMALQGVCGDLDIDLMISPRLPAIDGFLEAYPCGLGDES